MFYVYAGLIGLLGGLTSGMFGVGGGIVMVPAIMFLLKLDIKTAIGTSLAVMIPIACTGTFKHYQLEHVHWRLALAVVPAGMAGSFFSSWLTKFVHSDDLKRAFGGLLILVGARLLLFK
jgi:hypothetical protein